MSAVTTTSRRASAVPDIRVNRLAGTGTLIRWMLRRDRVRIATWLIALTVLTVATARSFSTLYDTTAAQSALARTMSSPAALAMTGPEHYLADYNVGAMMGHQMTGIVSILVGLMSVLMLTRHTRTEEETGRAELLRAAVVGRHAHLAAAMAVVVGVNLVLAVLLTLGTQSLGITGLGWSSSVLYGLVHAAVGVVFAAVAAVTVQIFEHSRTASGAAFVVIAVAFVLRAVGDVGNGVASWFSPIGWAQRSYVYVDDHWWSLLLPLGAVLVLSAAAVGLSTRRDVGAALHPSPGGTASASSGLLRPMGLPLRLHRGVLLGFAVGMLLLGAAYGSILNQVENLLDSVEGAAQLFQGYGNSLTESFVTRIIFVIAIISVICPVLVVSRIRSEETAGHAEPLLATALPRQRWIGEHIVVALVGGPVVLLSGALGFGLLGMATLSEPSFVPQVLGAALAYVPALWVTTTAALALFGWRPAVTPLAWVVVVYAFVVGYLGDVLRLPGWMSDLSPFGHVPELPAGDFTAIPLTLLTILAAALLALSVTGMRHRDLNPS